LGRCKQWRLPSLFLDIPIFHGSLEIKFNIPPVQGHPASRPGHFPLRRIACGVPSRKLRDPYIFSLSLILWLQRLPLRLQSGREAFSHHWFHLVCRCRLDCQAAVSMLVTRCGFPFANCPICARENTGTGLLLPCGIPTSCPRWSCINPTSSVSLSSIPRLPPSTRHPPVSMHAKRANRREWLCCGSVRSPPLWMHSFRHVFL